jgi:putative DNA primase/helicase
VTATSSIQRDMALDFLRTFYPADSPGWLTIWTLPGKGTGWFPPHKLADAADYALNLAATHDVYFGVGLRQEQLSNGRGTVNDVSAIPGFWIDIDLAHPVHQKRHLPETIQDVHTLISEAVPLPPSMLVDSGYGVHGYWLFRELWQFEDDAERRRAAHLLRRFQATIIAAGKRHGWNLDSTFSLAQVLRIPGSYNHKVAGEDREVTIQ